MYQSPGHPTAKAPWGSRVTWWQNHPPPKPQARKTVTSSTAGDNVTFGVNIIYIAISVQLFDQIRGQNDILMQGHNDIATREGSKWPFAYAAWTKWPNFDFYLVFWNCSLFFSFNLTLTLLFRICFLIWLCIVDNL